jgi:MOB kinase activator 1
LWADGVKYKKPVRLSAPEYVDKLFDWVEAQVGREGRWLGG